MVIRFIKNRHDDFVRWWKHPVKTKDRILGMIVGALGGFWIGLFASFVFLDFPIPFEELIKWAIGGGVMFSVLGIAFPKIVTVVCFPFSTFGASN